MKNRAVGSVCKCSQKHCVKAKWCYRKTAQNNPHQQAWQEFKPRWVKGKMYCDEQIPTGDKKHG